MVMIVEFETTIKDANNREYSVKLGTAEGGTISNPVQEPYCQVRLLPYKTFLFSADLDSLIWSGALDDGDATHEVPKETIEEIKAWAVDHGYELLGE